METYCDCCCKGQLKISFYVNTLYTFFIERNNKVFLQYKMGFMTDQNKLGIIFRTVFKRLCGYKPEFYMMRK